MWGRGGGGAGGALCVEPVLEVEGEREEKNTVGKPGKCDWKMLKRNNKERLKNNILIKIEF